MLSVAYEFFLDDEKVSRVVDFKERFGLNLLLHPRPDGHTLQSPANPNAHDLIFEALDRIRSLIHKYDLINKVILHLSTYRIPNGNYREFTEAEAISNSRVFYERLRDFGGVIIVLENVYPPGIGWEELGYETEHFSLFTTRDDYEICLDTGHLNLSTLKVEDILRLPFEITCLHLHSNDGTADQHLPLTQRNFKEWASIEKMLDKVSYVVLEVKGDLSSTSDSLKYLRKNQIMP